jgi:hypothetical protein
LATSILEVFFLFKYRVRPETAIYQHPDELEITAIDFATDNLLITPSKDNRVGQAPRTDRERLRRWAASELSAKVVTLKN